MAKQTFTTGQVLTAAQMTSLQQTAMGGGSTTAKTTSYVLTAADAGTVVQMNAAGATTITVNTALFAAGDTVQIQNIGAGVCTVTAGTATVSTAGSLALSQYEGGQLYFNTTSAALFFDIVQSSGMTNPMTTTGDIIYSSSGSTPARLGIGTTGQVLNVASGLPAWATPSSGGALTLAQIATGSFSGTSVTISSLSAYDTIILQMVGVTWGTADNNIRVRINSLTTGNYLKNGWAVGSGGSRIRQYAPTSTSFALQDPGDQVFNNATNNYFYIFTSCKNAGFTQVVAEGFYGAASSVDIVTGFNGIITSAEAVSSLVLATASGYTFSAGTYTVWGG